MRLIGEVFPALTTPGALTAAAFRQGVAANDASDRILYDPATGIIRYDADGTGPTAWCVLPRWCPRLPSRTRISSSWILS